MSIDAYTLGYKHALQQIAETESTDTPDGGWDSWLINGIGSQEVCRLFGEPCIDGWTDTMIEKLTAYHQGATKASEDIITGNAF